MTNENDSVPEWLLSVNERIDYLATIKDDGWHPECEDSQGITQEVIRDTNIFINKLVLETPTALKPILGLDSDGTVIINWNECVEGVKGLVGSVGICGDGEYYYYMKRGSRALISEGDPLSEPLSPKFVEFLLG